jgi:hypothetical protein
MASLGVELHMRAAAAPVPDRGVEPSTSPANVAVPPAERLRWFRELAALVASA